MRVLFLHNNFPGQYRRIMTYLQNDPLIEDMVACTLEANQQQFPLKKVVYKPHREVTKGIHPAAASFESSIINAQNVFQKLMGLKNSGWSPDLICGHSGLGADALPARPMAGCANADLFRMVVQFGRLGH